MSKIFNIFIYIIFLISLDSTNSYASKSEYSSSSVSSEDSREGKKESVFDRHPLLKGVIITVDGGGTRGIIPLYFLHMLQKKLGVSLVDKVNVWGGTSIGGITVLGLNKPSKEDASQPEKTPEDLIKLVQQEATTIFPKSIYNSVTSIGGLRTNIYPASGIEWVLREQFGDAKLSDSIGNVIVAGYDTSRGEPVFFKSATAKDPSKYGEFDFYSMDVARLTSAAQTYFPPAQIQSIGGRIVEGIDGGNVANNITASALVEARKRYPDVLDWLVISLGTGKVQKTMSYSQIKNKGGLFWLKPTLDITMNGASQVVDYQLRELLPPEESDTGFYRTRYHRFNPILPPENSDLDNASPENMRQLLIHAEAYYREHESEFNEIVKELRKRPSIKEINRLAALKRQEEMEALSDSFSHLDLRSSHDSGAKTGLILRRKMDESISSKQGDKEKIEHRHQRSVSESEPFFQELGDDSETQKKLPRLVEFRRSSTKSMLPSLGSPRKFNPALLQQIRSSSSSDALDVEEGLEKK